MQQRSENRSYLRGFLGLSALAHLNLLLLATAFLSVHPDGCSVASLDMEPLEVALVPSEELSLEQEPDQRLKEELKREEEREKEKEKEEQGQVVELPPPAEEMRPEKSRFLSEYDSRVKKETKSRPVPFKDGRLAVDRPVSQQQEQRQRAIPPQEQRRVEEMVMKLAMRSKPDLPRSQLPESEEGDAAPNPSQEDAEELPRGPAQVPARPDQPAHPSLDQLQLTPAELERALGTKVNDYLQDVEEGEQTLLNSKRWRFATFFNRVKRQVAQNWHPATVYRRRDPAGNVYGFRDRLTILRVRLNPAGKLLEVHLEQASGVEFLDDEAISAFRAAEPFPNPPAGLVDKDSGLISFSFGFLFEISRRPSFRIFRGN